MTASKTPLKIGLAGGIGSGKSYVARLLARHGISVYDCDNAAKRLMRSEEIQQQLEQLIGCKPDKQALTRFLLASDDNDYVDRVVVVTAPEEIRIQRIMQRDNISREQAHEWMQRQWPQERVRQMADYEIINDGLADVDQQITHLLGQLDLLSPLSS